MNKGIRPYIIIVVLMCTLFIVDKKFFNKELIFSPFTAWWNNVESIRDEHQMRIIILKEVPGLLDKNISDFDRLNRIREWVNAQTVWGKKTVDAKIRATVNEKTSLQMYSFLKDVKKPLDCGSYSVFLLKIYQLFGYDGYIYDMGKTGQFLHSVVLVWMNDNGKHKLIVEDPSFNLTYTNKDGSPIDFIKQLQLIKEKRTDKIVIKNSVGSKHKIICFLDDKCDLTGRKIEWKDANGTMIFKEPLDIQIMKNNLSSFLYCRYIRYYEKIKKIYPIIKPIEIALLKRKLRAIIEIN